jgi:heptosyltransferase-2
VKKYLIIQTASIGDVILSTSIGEKLRQHDPNSRIDYLVKKGTEGIFHGNIGVNEVYVWDKKTSKYKNLLQFIFLIRQQKYDYAINLQRFFSSGFITLFSGAHKTLGFKKNPLSIFFSHRFKHEYKDNWHEIDRNHQLIAHITDGVPAHPRLYPTKKDEARLSEYKTQSYITITPASLWFTKQFPKEKWIDFIDKLPDGLAVYFLGGAADKTLCDEIINSSKHLSCINFAGKLSLVESGVLMRDARMNYVNDSAAQHIASCFDAKTTTIYCSTTPFFGFGPLSAQSIVIENQLNLSCRPCGLHGHQACPKEHFDCANSIDAQQLLNQLNYD